MQCNTENFVPIVVPCLSTSCSSGSHPSTSLTPSRQERHCSSFRARLLHPTETSSDSENREREDQSEIDSPPVPVSS